MKTRKYLKKYNPCKDSTCWRRWIEKKHEGFNERLALFCCDAKKEKRRKITIMDL